MALRTIGKYKKHIAIGAGTAAAVGGGAYVYKKRRKPTGKKKSSRPMSPLGHAIVGGVLAGPLGAGGGYLIGKHRQTKWQKTRRAQAKARKTRAARTPKKRR